MKVSIPGGTFQDEPFHAYYADDGTWIPSLTQCFKLVGLSDYSSVNQEVLDRASERGTRVHELAATYNRHSDLDPSWIDEESEPYLAAYMNFLRDTGFQPDRRWTEQPMIATIAGYRVGVTPDCHGAMGKELWLLELKTTATRMPVWSIQTAMQEAAIYKSNRCGRVRRFALMLKKDRTYRLGEEHVDHENDMADGIAALRIVWRRIWSGQKVWEKLAA